MTTTFRHELRVLPCETCGAPLEGTSQGGRVRCRYCETEQELTPREHAPLVVGPRLSEPERLALLRAQDLDPRPPPATLAALVFGGRLVPWEVPEALARWQLVRRTVSVRREPGVAEELFALTTTLFSHYEREGEWLAARALAEGALDELGEPRQRQILRAALARAAALGGDLGAAEAWLAGCDATPADLESDGAFRIARACIETLRGDFPRVLELLGRSPTDVSLPNDLDPPSALLRANALERLGQPAQAADLLVHLAEHGGPLFHLRARELAERHPELRLCEASARAAEPRILHVWEARASSAGTVSQGCFLLAGVGILVPSLILAAALIVGSVGLASLSEIPLLAIAGSSTLLVAAFVSMLGTIFTFAGWDGVRKERATRRLLAEGRLLPGAVVQCAATGTETMGVPEVSIRALIIDGPTAYLASTETHLKNPEAPTYARGAPIAVRVDPEDPHAFVVVL